MHWFLSKLKKRDIIAPLGNNSAVFAALDCSYPLLAGGISAPHNPAAHTILFIHGHGIASIAKLCFSFSSNKTKKEIKDEH